MTNTQTISGQAQWKLAILVALFTVFPFAGAYADSMKTGSGVEVNIGSNGGVLVRGAQVTSVNNATVNADTKLGSSVLSWIVKTDADTDFSAHKGGTDGVANIAVGDVISFRGALDQSVNGLTVQAKQVKDWTSVETKAKIDGIVTSINTTLNSFTISKGNSTTTVETSSSTKFTDKEGSATFADIVLNAKVKIAGLFNASSSVVTASAVEIGDEGGSKKHGFRGWLNRNAWFKFWH